MVINLYHCHHAELRSPHDCLPVLCRTGQENVPKFVEVRLEGETVHEGLADVVGVLQGQLVQGAGLLPLLHEPHA